MTNYPTAIYLHKERETTWCEDMIHESDVLYIRADLVAPLIKQVDERFIGGDSKNKLNIVNTILDDMGGDDD